MAHLTVTFHLLNSPHGQLKLHTPDLTAANIDRTAALFSNRVTEAKDETGKLKRAIGFPAC